MAAENSAQRRMLSIGGLAFWLCVGVCACAGEERGTLEVQLSLRDDAGQAQGCDDLGAAEVEVSLYAREADTLVFDRIVQNCDVGANGDGLLTIRVASMRYTRVTVRLLSGSGNPVRMCRNGQSVDAQWEAADTRVTADGILPLGVTLQGDPGSCTN